jgi:hypothetical protein
MRWLLIVMLVLGVALFSTACQGDEEEKSGATATPTAAESPSPGATAESARTPDLAPGWTKIEPGGDTICSRGTPFVYFVHPGTVNRLVVYFQGGGACWSHATCSLPGLAKEAASDSDNPGQAPGGIFDLDNPDNPFKDWFFVFVPYCTGDIHWGDNTQTYTSESADDIVIHHKGSVNVSAVLGWIQDNLEKPEKIFVSGCSAGSYGSVMGAAHIHELFPDTPLYQLGDSGAGVMADDFFAESFPNWGAAENAPDWIPPPDGSWDEVSSLADLYIAVATFYPDDRWSQYNTAHDEIQTLFFTAMGGSGDWGELMLASIQEIQDDAPNFHAYIAPGEIHCVTGDDIFYSREVEGIKFSDWVDAMVNDEAWDDVMCSDCETDPEAQ